MPVFNCDGVDLYYEIHGDENSKNTIAFFNGVMASVSSWYPMIPVFEKMGFKIILHDFKGQMKSGKPEEGYSFARHAAEAKALFQHLSVEHAHVIGTSYGGEVAMKLAILYPEITDSICYSRVWFNTPPNLRFALAAAQIKQRLQKFGIKPKNPLTRGRV
jgi:3-oxoadipate enol-lactonase